jgi:hypothetical protein
MANLADAFMQNIGALQYIPMRFCFYSGTIQQAP